MIKRALLLLFCALILVQVVGCGAGGAGAPIATGMGSSMPTATQAPASK